MEDVMMTSAGQLTKTPMQNSITADDLLTQRHGSNTSEQSWFPVPSGGRSDSGSGEEPSTSHGHLDLRGKMPALFQGAVVKTAHRGGPEVVLAAASPSSSELKSSSNKAEQQKAGGKTCHKCGGAIRRGKRLNPSQRCNQCGTHYHTTDCGDRLQRAGYDLNTYLQACPRCNNMCACKGGGLLCHVGNLRNKRIAKMKLSGPVNAASSDEKSGGSAVQPQPEFGARHGAQGFGDMLEWQAKNNPSLLIGVMAKRIAETEEANKTLLEEVKRLRKANHSESQQPRGFGGGSMLFGSEQAADVNQAMRSGERSLQQQLWLQNQTQRNPSKSEFPTESPQVTFHSAQFANMAQSQQTPYSFSFERPGSGTHGLQHNQGGAAEELSFQHLGGQRLPQLFHSQLQCHTQGGGAQAGRNMNAVNNLDGFAAGDNANLGATYRPTPPEQDAFAQMDQSLQGSQLQNPFAHFRPLEPGQE